MTDVQPVPMPASTVTLLDIYTRQVEMGAQLAVIHEQLKAIPDHERRIRVLESSRSKLYGAVLAVSTFVSAGGAWIGFLITRRH